MVVKVIMENVRAVLTATKQEPALDFASEPFLMNTDRDRSGMEENKMDANVQVIGVDNLNHYGNDFDIFYAKHEQTSQWGRKHVEAYIAEGNTNKVIVTSSNTTVHNLTYKDYMDKNSLTDEQKVLLEELMSADTFTLYGSGAIGVQVAQMAMTKVGCGYSQDKRMQEGWYDCSSLVYRRYKEAGIILNATDST